MTEHLFEPSRMGNGEQCKFCNRPEDEHFRLKLNPSDEKLREMIAEKDREIEALRKDAERYRKLKARFNASVIMANGRRWWDCNIATEPEFENLDQVADWLSEANN